MTIMDARWIKKNTNTLFSNASKELTVKLDATNALESTIDGIKIKSLGITDDMLAGGISDGKLASSYIFADGTRAMTGNLNLGGHKITDLSDATFASEAVTLAQLQQLSVQSKLWKEVLFASNQLFTTGIAAAQVIKLTANLTAGDVITLNDGTITQTLTAGTNFAIGATINDTIANLSAAINTGTIAISAVVSSLTSIDDVNNVIVVMQDTVGEPTRIYGNAANVRIAPTTLANMYEAVSSDLVGLPATDPVATNFGFYRTAITLAANETHLVRSEDTVYTWDNDSHTWQMTGATSIPYATKSLAGKVQVGSNIKVASGGIISVEVGNGLQADSDIISVNPDDLAGDGLSASADDLSVDTAAIAGAGLETDGTNNLRIAASAAGNGLTGGAGQPLSVNPAIAGDGLFVDTADGVFELTVGSGNGVKVNSDNIELTALSADWNAGSTYTIQVKDPVNNTDAANKQWVTSQINNTDAANKQWVTSQITTLTTARAVEQFILTSVDITNKYVTLAVPATAGATVTLSVAGAPAQAYGIDYTYDSVTHRVTWSGLSLDGLLEAGDVVIVEYNR